MPSHLCNPLSKGMELAARAEEYIEGSPVLEVMNPASLGIVCFRVNPADASLDTGSLQEINRTVLARIFWEDRAFISSTLLHGKFSLRMCIINYTTTWDDVRETLEAVERFGTETLSSPVLDQWTTELTSSTRSQNEARI